MRATAVKTTESILSAITTGWLSHLSDVYGRKRILALTVSGALFMCIIFPFFEAVRLTHTTVRA